MAAVSTMIINIPPLEMESLMAAAGLLQIVSRTGVDMTMVEVTPTLHSASCRIPPNPNPLTVVGSSRAECLTKLLGMLTGAGVDAPVVPVPE